MSDLEPWEFNEWQAFYRLEPWGDDWVQAARIEAAIINANTTGDPVNPYDLVPNEDNRTESEEMDAAALRDAARAMAGL